MNLEVRINKVFHKFDRRFLIITDDIELTKENREEALMNLEFADNILYMTVNEATEKFNKKLSLTVEKCQYHIMIINDISTVIEGESIFYLMNSIETKKFSYIVVENDRASELEKAYRTLYGCKLISRYMLSFDTMIALLEEVILPRNIMIAFISDNDDYMNWLFDKYFGTIEESDGHEEDNEDEESFQTDAYLPCRGLPKIFMGWIYRIWYGVSEDNDDKAGDTETPETIFEDDTTESYTKRTVIIKIDDNTTVTYVWIKPNKDLNLTEVTKEFDTVYFDLATFYANVVFEKYENMKPIRYFLSVKRKQEIMHYITKHDTAYLLNIAKNHVDYLDISYGAERIMSNWNDDTDDCDLSGTIYVDDFGIKFDNIAMIQDIIIDADLEEETE